MMYAGCVTVVLALLLTGTVLARSAEDGPGRVDQRRPGPVLLVPGYGGGTAGLEALAARLRAAGRDATVVALPGNGTGDLDRQSDALAETVEDVLAAGSPSVDLVGYSAGGVVARLWAARHGGAGAARRVVTLGSPHHGTDLAAVAGTVLPGACPAACRELVPGSDLLARLNQGDETPEGPRWVSIWSAQDEVVTPPSSASLEGALNLVVQDVCPGRQVSHGQLPTDPVVTGLVLRALAVDEPVAPGPADCAALAATP